MLAWVTNSGKPKARITDEDVLRFIDEDRDRRFIELDKELPELRVLDLTREDVREAARGATDARTLYRSDAATDYA